jgi:hypothetical protein
VGGSARLGMQAHRSARAYNELTIIKSLEHMANMAAEPLPAFRDEIACHMRLSGPSILARYAELLSDDLGLGVGGDAAASWGTFPLLPVSRGFKLSLAKRLDRLKSVLGSA